MIEDEYRFAEYEYGNTKKNPPRPSYLKEMSFGRLKDTGFRLQVSEIKNQEKSRLATLIDGEVGVARLRWGVG